MSLPVFAAGFIAFELYATGLFQIPTFHQATAISEQFRIKKLCSVDLSAQRVADSNPAGGSPKPRELEGSRGFLVGCFYGRSSGDFGVPDGFGVRFEDAVDLAGDRALEAS